MTEVKKNPKSYRKKLAKVGGNDGSVHVIGTGKDGCVLKGVLPANCNPEKNESLSIPSFPRNEVITKVAINENDFKKEWDNAKILHTLDPLQTHFLYPFKKCESSIPLDEKTFNDCKFNKHNSSKKENSSKNIFLLEMRYGGKSLKQMKKQGDTLTREQAHKVIEDVRAALFKLHSEGYVHGDIHHGNVVVWKNDISGEVKAYLIDFGYFKSISDDEKLTEVENFLERIILGTISQITEGGRFRVIGIDGKIVKYPNFTAVENVSYSFVPAFSPVKASPVRGFLNFGSPTYPSPSDPGPSIAKTPDIPVKSRFERSAMKTAKRDLFADF